MYENVEPDEETDSPIISEEPPPEGGWGWVVCVAAFFVTFTIFGIHNSFGVFYVTLVKELKLGEAQTAWIGSIAGSLNFLCGPLASFLCDRFGCQAVGFIGGVLSVLGLLLSSFVQEPAKLYVTYGLLWGVGSGLSFTPSIIVLGQYFHKRFPLVNGIAGSGSGVGGLVTAPFVSYLLSRIGWQNSFRVLAGIANLIWFSAILYRPLNKVLTQSSSSQSNNAPVTLSIWRSKPYVILVASVALFMLCYPVPYTHLVNFSKDIGIPSSRGAWLLGILSITSTVSKIIFGKISESQCVNRRMLMQLAMFSIGLSTVLCPLAVNYAGVLCYVLVYGMFDGCFVLLTPVVTRDIVGHEHLSKAVGYMFGVIAAPLSLGAPMAGWLYQAFDSYNGPFHVAGSVAIFTSLLLFLIPYLETKHNSYDVSYEVNIDNDVINDDTNDVSGDVASPLQNAKSNGPIAHVRFSERSSKSGSFPTWQAMPTRRESYEVAVQREDVAEKLTVVQKETVL